MLSKKGFWWGRPATLIQDQKHLRNLDSKIHLLGFVRFNLEFHSPNAVTFSTVSTQSGGRAWAKRYANFLTSFLFAICLTVMHPRYDP